MKNLMKLQTLMLMLFVSSAMILGSCKKDSTTTPTDGDKTALKALIAESEALVNAATTADYPQAAIDNFKTTLQTVKTASASILTQAQITNLVTQLTEAKKTFASQQYGFIDESLYLNAGWHFDEGTGTTATAFSSGHNVGTFTLGDVAILGAANAKMPTWATGVKGGKAIYLNGGAHLEVPYSTAFLPVNLSISVWVKPDSLYENNYIISQNYWNGYKLQTQSGGKPYFTYMKSDGVNIIDADNEMDNSITANAWNHIVITLDGTSKLLKFYVNGVLTKTWTETDKIDKGGIGPLTQTLTPSAQPFMIGCVATDAEIAANMAWTNASNLGFFCGIIDELKIYNIALTNGQVGKLYNDEKP